MKKFIVTAWMAVFSMVAFAQSSTKSPYSQYGLGVLADQSNGFNRGMNGLAYGLREHNQVNFKNPASYSAIDSLSFIFDAGVSLQLSNFEENGLRKNAKTANFEYATAAFRIAKHFGASFGIMPFSNIGYDFSNTERVNEFPSTTTASTTYTNTFHGEGGLHQVYIGAGWEPIRGISLGVNFSYLWGEYTRSAINSYSDAYVNTISKIYAGSVSSYKVDFGIQLSRMITKTDRLTLGAVYNMGHKLGADPECLLISSKSQYAQNDTTKFTVKDGLAIPDMFGGGISWEHNNQFAIGIDYQWQRWSKIDFPIYTITNDQPSYKLVSNQFSDNHKLTFGGEYCKNERARSFLGRLHYRAGVSYATPYLKINGEDGPREVSVSAGFGIPIINGYNNRSILNISGQWVNQKASGFINENSFRINICFTFNERWFAKFKVE